MGIQRSGGGNLVWMVEAAEQRQAYNNFRKAQVFFRKVVERTPVLSGALRASWHASYGVPDYSYVDIENKRKVTAPLPKPDFPLEYDKRRAWKIVISNSSPYASVVENGDSHRAPVGMVRLSLMEVYGVGLR